MKEAGGSATNSTANLAVVARRDRDGEVEVEFVDAATMSQPRAEELHRLEISLSDGADSPFEMGDKNEDEDEEEGETPLEDGLFKRGRLWILRRPSDTPRSPRVCHPRASSRRLIPTLFVGKLGRKPPEILAV